MTDYCSNDEILSYQAQLTSIAKSRGVSQSDAEEIAQETIARFWVRRHEVIRKGDPFPWMVTVATHLSIDRVRAQKKVAVADENEMEVHAARAAVAPSALEVVLAFEESETIANAVKRLSDVDQSMLLHRDLWQEQYQTISTQLNVSVNTARIKVFRARRRLATLLEEARYFGLLTLLRLRGRRATTPSELPVFAATALAQVAVPLAIVGSVLSGGFGMSGASSSTLAGSAGIAAAPQLAGITRSTIPDSHSETAAGMAQPAAVPSDAGQRTEIDTPTGSSVEVEGEQTADPNDAEGNGRYGVTIEQCTYGRERCVSQEAWVTLGGGQNEVNWARDKLTAKAPH